MNVLQMQKIGLMIRHAEQGGQRVAQRLARQKREHDDLQGAIGGLAMQWREIERLLQSQKLADRVVDRADLFMLQQRQAVLRQRQYQLNFERDRLREEIETLEQAQLAARAELAALKRKREKFSHWAGVQKRGQMLRRLQREESDSEERAVSFCLD